MSDPEQTLVQALDRLIPLYLRALRQALADAEGADRLTMPQLRVLQFVANASDRPATTTQLAEHMSVTSPTMSSMLDGLSGRGLVERRLHPDDRRRVAIVITETGRVVLDRYQSIINACHRSIVSVFEPDQQRAISRAVELLVDRLARLDEPGERLGDGAEFASSQE